VAQANAIMDSLFMRKISEGRIRNLLQLKSAYRSLVMKTHPDAVGSDRLTDTFVRLSSEYEDAKAFLESRAPFRQSPALPRTKNNRLAFYQVLQRLQSLDSPYSFNRSDHLAAITESKHRAWEYFWEWDGAHGRLYRQAQHEYDRLKAEKPSGPYLQHALALNVSPVFHNIITYHLTGIGFYKRQVKQNLSAILQRLLDGGYSALRDFLLLLIQDMDAGAAVFGSSRPMPLARRLEARCDRPSDGTG
jgi:hypothetical protein